MERAKNQDGPQSSTRRRSKRSRTSSASNNDSVECKPPGNGRKKKKTSSKKPVSAPHKECQAYQPGLLNLPDAVQAELLSYLSVDILLDLAQTCSYYHQLIKGRFLTNISLPFEEDFLKELREARTLEKKPLLRLESTKPRSLLWEFDPNAAQYVLEFQFSLLDLHRVREVYLVPSAIRPGEEETWKRDGEMEIFKVVDTIIMRRMSNLGYLRNISRLDLLILDLDFSRTVLEEFMPELTNLLVFSVSIAEPTSSIEAFYTGLEKIVSSSKAHVFKLIVLSDSQKSKTRKPKVFSNDHIEKFVVSGPCNFHLQLKMKNLREVVLGDQPVADSSGQCCFFKKKTEFDRKMHILGSCIIHIGSTFKTCPKLKKFDDVNVISQRGLGLNAWLRRLRRPFYQDYLEKGGEERFKSWARTRWNH